MRFWKFWYRLAFRFCIRLGLLIPRNAGLCDMVKFWEDRKKCEKITNFIWCCLLSSNLGDFFKFMKPSQSIWTLRTNCPLGLKKHYAAPMGRASTSKLLTLRAANIPPGPTLPKHDAHKKGACFWQIHMPQGSDCTDFFSSAVLLCLMVAIVY